MASWYDRGYFPPSRPLEAKGGIKAQSKRAHSVNPVGKAVDCRPGKLQHRRSIGPGGGNYARKGQVLSVEIEKGRVTAKVQGSRSRPYEVTINVKTLSERT